VGEDIPVADRDQIPVVMASVRDAHLWPQVRDSQATGVAALLFFGAHLALLGHLAYRSGYVPRLIGVLLVIAGVGYAFDTVSSVLSADPMVISTFTFLGELLLAVWLVARSHHIQLGTGHEL
jgi:hypothetical protein